MTLLNSRFTKSSIASGFLFVAILCRPAFAVQEEDTKALELVRWGMQAYSNLNLNEATSALEEALSLAPGLSPSTLARIYVSFGVLWSGGLADSAKGQESFLIALCLDPDIEIDPLLLTPEIETEFKLVHVNATPEACESILAEVDHSGAGLVPTTSKATVVQPEGLEMCGVHHPLTEQKKNHELPFFLMLKPQLSNRIATIKVMYSFDAPKNFKELTLSPMGGGYGFLLSCGKGEIRILDPSNVYYYIEARDSSGGVVCGHASDTVPIQIRMAPDTQPIVPIAGMEPKECTFCEPWDVVCRKKMAGTLPKLDEDCQPVPGCAEGLFCGDSGLCELEEEKPGEGEGSGGPALGPKRFYFNAMFGTGFGYASNWSVRTTEDGIVATRDGTAVGWSGLPVRLGAGILISDKFAIELTARFDLAVTGVIKEPQICTDSNLSAAAAEWCNDPSNVDEGMESHTQAQDDLGTLYYNENSHVSWLINARARYTLLRDRYMGLSLFGGLGFGYFRYRMASKRDESFFPMIGIFDIELGPAISVYFNDHVGLHFELPIDLLMGDGFAFNVDFTIGLAVGF